MTKCVWDSGINYVVTSRWLKVHWNKLHSDPYFNYCGRRHHLSEFSWLPCPVMFDVDDGKLVVLSKLTSVENEPYDRLLEIDDCVEYVRVWIALKGC